MIVRGNMIDAPDIQILNRDCMEYMQSLPDGAFDLALCDPPYGIGKEWKKKEHARRRGARREKFIDTTYANEKPQAKYFEEVQRIAKKWIIWGYNYFTDLMPPTNYLICWDKCCADNFIVKYSQFELAGTNIRYPARVFRHKWDGACMGSEHGNKKIHPHQKPVALYKWLLMHYAERGYRILDTHLGSASIALACWELGFDLVGCEIDVDYYNLACARLKAHKQQMTLTLDAHIGGGQADVG